MNVDEIKNEIAKLEYECELFPSIEKKEKIKKLKSILVVIENEEKEKLKKEKANLYNQIEVEQKNKHVVRKRR